MTLCVISKSPSVEEIFVKKIRATLPKPIEVEEQTYLQATAGLPPEVILIIFWFANPVAQGFLQELGKEAYSKLKETIIPFLARKETDQVVNLEFKGKGTTVSFRCQTDNEEVATAALGAIPPIVEAAKRSIWFRVFENGKWQEIKRKVAYTVQGTVATMDPVTINGKKVSLTKAALRKAAKQAPNMPILVEHGGAPIGKVVKAWVEGERLIAKFELFEPETEKEKETVERMKSGDLRFLSMGFSY